MYKALNSCSLLRKQKVKVQAKKGFTLMELVICIMLISLVLSIESPFIFNYSSKRQDALLNETVYELMSDLRLYQQKAMTEGRMYDIYFNSIEGSYMVYTYIGMGNSVCKQKRLPGCVYFDSAHSTYSNNKVTFNSKGKPLPYPCTISLKNSSGQHMEITITVGTDYIGIKDV